MPARRGLVLLLVAFGAIAVAAIVIAVVATRGGGSKPSKAGAASNESTTPKKQDVSSSDDKCALASLKCDQFSSQGRAGMKLHELVYDARTHGRNSEAICLAQNNVGASDGWLAGASHFETSNAWEALGCHDLAVSEVVASLQVRPHGRSGWKETCDWCAQIHGACSACGGSSERVACPGNSRLVAIVGTTMLSQAPSGTTWNEPSIDLCTPIALPQAGWFVVGSVRQEIPDRTFQFHMAVDAQSSKVIATSEGEQHSSHEACETKLVSVDDHPGAPSTVRTREDCVDKMGRAFNNSHAATISPPQVLVR